MENVKPVVKTLLVVKWEKRVVVVQPKTAFRVIALRVEFVSKTLKTLLVFVRMAVLVLQPVVSKNFAR
jgi:hypothetical protein